MRKKTTDEQIKADRWRKQLDRQAEYSKAKYDHISLVLPKGYKQLIQTVCSMHGYKSASEYVKHLMDMDGVCLSMPGEDEIQD